METANDRFKHLRKQLNISQEHLGEALGISKSGVSSIENGARQLSNKHLKMLSIEYPEINVDWLLTGEGEMILRTESSVITDLEKHHSLDSMDKEIIQLYIELSQKERQVVKNYLISVAKKIYDIAERERTDEEEIKAMVAEYEKELWEEKRAKDESSALEDQQNA